VLLGLRRFVLGNYSLVDMAFTPKSTMSKNSRTSFFEDAQLKWGFYRQLDWLVTVLTLLVFAACALSGALTIKASLLISAGVFLIGIFFGRRIAKVLELF
jgi:hypothetical protein